MHEHTKVIAGMSKQGKKRRQLALGKWEREQLSVHLQGSKKKEHLHAHIQRRIGKLEEIGFEIMNDSPGDDQPVASRLKPSTKGSSKQLNPIGTKVSFKQHLAPIGLGRFLRPFTGLPIEVPPFANSNQIRNARRRRPWTMGIPATGLFPQTSSQPRARFSFECSCVLLDLQDGSTKWEEYYDFLPAIQAKHHHLSIPCNYETPNGIKLGSWAQKQRFGYATKLCMETPECVVNQ